MKKNIILRTINKCKKYLRFWKLFQVSETNKCRSSLAKYCKGDGLDIGYGGDPIVKSAICIDLPRPYAKYRKYPQHLHGDARDLYWFKNQCLDYVFSSHLLEDFKNTEIVLNEWIRVLKLGGYLVLYLPDEQKYRNYCKKKGVPSNIHHMHEDFSIDYINKILKKRTDIEIIHTRFPAGIYSFELVIQKVK